MCQQCSFHYDVPLTLQTQELMVKGQCPPTTVASSRRISDRIWDLLPLGVVDWPSWALCWFLEINISPIGRYIPLDLNHLVWVAKWFQIYLANACQWIHVKVNGYFLLAGRIFHFAQCHNGLVCRKKWHMCSIAQFITRGVSWYKKLQGSKFLRP